MYLRVERPGVTNISLQSFGTELGMDGLVLEPVHIDDVLRDVQVRLLVALVEHDKE